MPISLRKAGFVVLVLAGSGMSAACAEPATVTATRASSGGLSCALALSGPPAPGQAVSVELLLHNGLDVPVRVLRYFTPFEGILGEIFEVQWQNQPVIYEGPMVKRVAPGEDDWLPLPAGQDLTAAVDVSSAWNLTLPGEYRVQLRNGISFRVPDDPEPRQLEPADCGAVGFIVESS
jgi:hypothetical protein